PAAKDRPDLRRVSRLPGRFRRSRQRPPHQAPAFPRGLSLRGSVQAGRPPRRHVVRQSAAHRAAAERSLAPATHGPLHCPLARRPEAPGGGGPLMSVSSSPATAPSDLPLSGRRVLVPGGLGFLGLNLVPALLAAGG